MMNLPHNILLSVRYFIGARLQLGRQPFFKVYANVLLPTEAKLTFTPASRTPSICMNTVAHLSSRTTNMPKSK